MIYLSPPDVGALERRMLLDAFDSNWIAPVGPDLDAFEAEFARWLGMPHAAAVSSGTAALHLALDVLQVGPGDDVLVSDLTFVATANAVRYRGARPVFVDSDEVTWNMDPELLAVELDRRAAIGRLPAAVIVVDIYGQCADYSRITPICRRFGVPVVEDAAEALGATAHGEAAGTFGDIGAFSFNGNKIITTSGGGMLVCRRREWAEHARFLATQAKEPAPHYEHHELGYNYRLSNLLAALGRAQLQSLADRVQSRRATNAAYRAALADVDGIGFMPEAPGHRSSCWLTVLTVDPRRFGANRDELAAHLAAHGIESRPTWKPMHLQRVFRGTPIAGGRVSEWIFEVGLCVPSGSNLTAAELDFVVDTIRRATRRTAPQSAPARTASGVAS